MTMRTAVLVLACMASSGHGRRVRSSAGGQSADNQDTTNAVKLFELLLQAESPAAGWRHPGAPVGQLPMHQRTAPTWMQSAVMEEAAPVEVAGEHEVSSWYDAGIRLGSEKTAAELEKPDEDVASEGTVSSWYDAGIRLGSEKPAEESGTVSSWYDAGIRLNSEEPTKEEVAGDGEVSSWYDAGIRLSSEETKEDVELEDAMEVDALKTPAMMEASTQASLVAALISATTVLGIDLASFGTLENADLALLVGGIALSQVDSGSPLGTTLRTVGNVTSEVFNKGVYPVAKAAADFYEENEVGWTARAVLELGLEKAFYALSPEARERALREAQEKAAAAEAARREAERIRLEEERQAYKDSLPFWSPEKYFD